MCVEEAESNIEKYVPYVQELYFESPFKLGTNIIIVVDVPHVNRAMQFTSTEIIK
jgi:hypothetical protein